MPPQDLSFKAKSRSINAGILDELNPPFGIVGGSFFKASVAVFTGRGSLHLSAMLSHFVSCTLQ